MIDEQVTPKRLYRSRRDRMLAGVCGGLGQYFNVDPVLMRLGCVVLTLSTGVGLIAYIILALVVPLWPDGEAEPATTSSTFDGHRGAEIVGYGLAGLGLLLLAGNLGLWRIVNWDWVWPLVLIGLGVALLVRRR